MEEVGLSFVVMKMLFIMRFQAFTCTMLEISHYLKKLATNYFCKTLQMHEDS